MHLSFKINRRLRFPLCVLGISIFLFILGLQLLATSTSVQAAEPLDCSSCHQPTLEYHDQLGSGNNACWACHSPTDMYSLRLADGTQLSLTESSRLCGQCHETRYSSWQEGTHGFPGTVATGKCTNCHDPHKPQMAFTGVDSVTRAHPANAPPPSSLPSDPLMVAVIFLLFLIFLFFIVIREDAE